MTEPVSADLSHIESWIFDLDNTLYPSTAGVFSQIDVRMTDFVARKLNLDPGSARALQKAYLHSHGTTLNGLMDLHGIEPHGFLDYVHDIDLSMLSPIAGLAAALKRLPGRRIVYTNGSRRHAERVIERLGITDLFDDLHDIAAAEFRPKPHAAAYETLLVRHDIDPLSAAMFEDMSRNLEAPHALGMTTILIGTDAQRAPFIDHITDDLAPFLAGARVMPYEKAAKTDFKERA
jgi:putative hydrolase of the HAD superfamily